MGRGTKTESGEIKEHQARARGGLCRSGELTCSELVGSSTHPVTWAVWPSNVRVVFPEATLTSLTPLPAAQIQCLKRSVEAREGRRRDRRQRTV